MHVRVELRKRALPLVAPDLRRHLDGVVVSDDHAAQAVAERVRALAAVLLPALGGKVLAARPGDTQEIATQLFGSWVWPFELLSLLLLVALIAIIIIVAVTLLGKNLSSIFNKTATSTGS